MNCYHIFPHLITSYHILSHLVPYPSQKIIRSDNFKFSPQTPQIVITSSHILSRLITSYHILSPILHRKLFAVTTLNLVPRLHKLLSHLPTSYTSYHILSHLIPYPSQKISLSDNFKFSTQTPQIVITSSHILSRLITSYHILSPILHRKLFAVTTLNLVPRLLELLSHLPTSYHVLSHLITSYPLSFTEN